MISVIIPVSNNESTITECINSVLLQNYNKYEIILVLNNSKDNTKSIIKKNFSNKKIKFFTIKKTGPSAARNYGIRKSKMKYILFLDADDLLIPGCLLYLSNLIRKKNVKALYNSHTQLGSNYYKQKKKIDGIKKSRFFYSKQIKNYLVKFSLKPNIFSAFVHCWGNLYNRRFLLKNKITFDESLDNLEDVVFNINVFKKLQKIYYDNKYTYVHRVNSLSGRQSFKIDKNNINSILTIEKVLNSFLKDELKNKKNILKHYVAWNIINLLIRLSKSKINFVSLNNFVNELYNSERIKDSFQYYILFKEYNKFIIYFLKYRQKKCLIFYVFIYSLYNKFINLIRKYEN